MGFPFLAVFTRLALHAGSIDFTKDIHLQTSLLHLLGIRFGYRLQKLEFRLTSVQASHLFRGLLA